MVSDVIIHKLKRDEVLIYLAPCLLDGEEALYILHLEGNRKEIYKALLPIVREYKIVLFMDELNKWVNHREKVMEGGLYKWKSSHY